MGAHLSTPNTSSLVVKSRILARILQVDKFKGAWRALGTLAPERLSSLRGVTTIESIGSSTGIDASIAVTENHIRQLHRGLLKHSPKDERHRRPYKTSANGVAAFGETGTQIGIVFETTTRFDTRRRMQQLIDWFQNTAEDMDMHSLLRIGVFVVVFLEMYLFQDGTGRLSRVLMRLLLLQAGYSYVAYSSMESVIEQSKEAYDIALRHT